MEENLEKIVAHSIKSCTTKLDNTEESIIWRRMDILESVEKRFKQVRLSIGIFRNVLTNLFFFFKVYRQSFFFFF